MAYAPGNYNAIITGHLLTKSKDKGTPEIKFAIKPLEREDGAPMGDTGPRSLSLYITENTADRVTETLIGLGYPYDTFDQLAVEHPQFHSFEGREARVYMKTEVYKDKDVERWNFDGGAPAVPMAKNEASALNKFAGAFKAKRAEMGVPSKKPAPKPAMATAPNNSTFDDGDVI